jgi:hypothetical protein
MEVRLYIASARRISVSPEDVLCPLGPISPKENARCLRLESNFADQGSDAGFPPLIEFCEHPNDDFNRLPSMTAIKIEQRLPPDSLRVREFLRNGVSEALSPIEEWRALGFSVQSHC